MNHALQRSQPVLRILTVLLITFSVNNVVRGQSLPLPVDFPNILHCYSIQQVDATDLKGMIEVAFPSKVIVDVHPAKNLLLIWATAETHREIHDRLQQRQYLVQTTPGNSKNRSSGIIPAFYTQSGEDHPQVIRLVDGQSQAPMPLPLTRPQGVQYQELQSEQSSQFVVPNTASNSIPNTMPTQIPNAAPQQINPQINATPPQTRSIVLRNLSAADFEKKLISELGRRFVNVSPVSSTTETTRYQLPLLNGQAVEMLVNRNQNSVTISGNGRSVDAFIQVVSLIDSDAKSPNIATELVPFNPMNTQAVSETIRAIGKSSQVAHQRDVSPTAQNSQGANSQGTKIAVRQVPAESQTTPGGASQGFTIPGGAGLVGPVTVEILDDGIVVVRGNENDVKIVKEMLAHLETISMEHEPKILLHPLAHADSARVSTMLRQLYTEVYQYRKGSISITSLVKPNALLLIGYEGSIEAALELLSKLDIAVDAETQFQVFRLKHASVSTLQTSIESFYANRTALGTAVVVTSDVRTNSLIVQASPRDLMEIAALVMKIDVGSSEVVDGMKVIPLMNTLASDLAPVVQQAITGRTTTQGFGGGTTQQSGERSAVLSFRTIEPGKSQVIQSDVFTDVRITADTRGNNIIIVAPEKCMPLIEALVRQLDSAPKAVAQIKVFTIVNSDAQTLLTMLNNLFVTTQAGGGVTGQPAVRTGASAEESSLIPVRFAIDTRTNSIVASGTEGDLSIIEAILIRLDERDLQNRRVAVYRLLNTQSAAVARALNEYLTGERSIRQSTQVLIGDVDRFKSEVIVVDEAVTNSLIISTTPRYYDQMKLIIKELDERPPMVSIAVLIAEVTLSNTDELGFELGLQDAVLFDRGTLGDIIYKSTTTQTASGQVQNQEIISSTTTPGFDFANTTRGLGQNASQTNPANVGTQGVTNFALGRQNGDLGYSGFAFSASSESVSVLIRALEEKQKITILHKPTLTTMHNEASYLQVGQNVQRVTGMSANDYGQTTQMVPEDVGVILKVTPRVSADGRIVMMVDASKSTMGKASDGTPIGIGPNGTPVMSPNINISKVQTTVSTSSGQTIILGGLINEETTYVHRGVPWFSSLPLVGALFQYNYNMCARKELLFIMTPRILRSDEEIRAMTQLETSRMAWCATNIACMMGDDIVMKRTDAWNASNTRVELGDVFVPTEEELMPSKEIVDRSTIQDLPLPKIAPTKK